MSELAAAVELRPDTAQGRSRIDEIKARRQARAASTFDLKPSLWGGEVVVRCKRLTEGQIVRSSKIDTKWAQNGDLVCTACVEVLITDEDGQLVPPIEGEHVRIDGRLQDMLELTGDEPRGFARSLWSNDVELQADAKRLFDWSSGETGDLKDPEDEELPEA